MDCKVKLFYFFKLCGSIYKLTQGRYGGDLGVSLHLFALENK